MYLNLVSRTNFDIREIWVSIKTSLSGNCIVNTHVILMTVSFLVRHVGKDEKKYYEDMLSHSRENLMV